jgi:hypothetical protein
MSAVTKDELHRLIDELDDSALAAARRALELLRPHYEAPIPAPAGVTPVDIPADIAARLAFLDILDDAALWRAAHTRFPQPDGERLEELNDKAQREGLTVAERDEQASLLDQYGDVALIRAKSALLLKQRGYDITDLLPN